MIARLVVLCCTLAIASSSHASNAEKGVWFWFSSCGATKLVLQVKLDAQLVYSSTIPICRRERDSDGGSGETKTLSFTSKPARPIKWEGYRDDEPVTKAGKALTVDLWQAGADPGALLIGVTVMDTRQIYMNTIHIAYPDRPSSTTLADGFVIDTHPSPAGAAVSTHAADDRLECVYAENTPTAELEAHAGCARRVKGRIRIQQNHLARMFFDANGLAWVVVSRQHYYVKRDGSTLPVITYDNGPDSFKEGLARSRVNGRIAYYDASFRQRIPPRFDWGFPFENGLAWVCRGCREGPRDSDGHAGLVGGVWGCIDKTGREVLPVSLSDSDPAIFVSCKP